MRRSVWGTVAVAGFIVVVAALESVVPAVARLLVSAP